MNLSVDLAQARAAGAMMLGAGALLPLLDHPGPGCALRALTGVPCPLCGMSTSVQSTMRLDLAQALEANPAGVLAVACAVVLLFARPRRTVRVPLWSAGALLVGMWLYELFRYSIV
ncbi:MAG: DUF2752 domain-containing protein [Actinomycetota bacterium]